MGIKVQTTAPLTQQVTVILEPADYNPSVEKAIKKYAAKAAVPGFRPGKVPVTMVKKMYGKHLLVDEVNRLVGESLNNYIEENQLNLLGNPLPSETVSAVVDFDNPGTMEFTFDMGLAPQINVSLDSSRAFTRFVVSPTESDIENALDNICRRNGEMTNPETVGESDMVRGLWVELKDGEPKPGGVMHSSSLLLDTVTDETTKNDLVGKKVGDVITINHNNVANNEADHAAMLGVDRAKLPSLEPEFRFTIERIQRLVPAQLNNELVQKMYPDGSVTDVEALKERVRQDYRNHFDTHSDSRLFNDIATALMQETVIELPEAFLKRWMLDQHDHDHATHQHTPDEVDAEYANFSQGLRWQLIEANVVRQSGLTLTADELKAGVRDHLRQQFAQYGLHQATDEMMEDMTTRFMKRKDEVRRVSEHLMEKKMLAVFKERFKLDDKLVSSDEFYGRA